MTDSTFLLKLSIAVAMVLLLSISLLALEPDSRTV
jgi:hypothetical protein